MADVTVLYRGILEEHDHGEGMDILFLRAAHHDRYSDDDPLAQRIEDDIDHYGQYLTVRYWTAAEFRSDKQMVEGALREMLGAGDARFKHAYSEITGYLWTDEEINVGGHDLLEELRSQKGRYCVLEITYTVEAPISGPTHPVSAGPGTPHRSG